MDGRNSRLALLCKQIQQHQVDIIVVTETKLNKYFPIFAYGYNIATHVCENTHQGGVTILYKDSKNWHLEDITLFGKTVIVHGEKCNVLIGIYIPPLEDNETMINNLDQAMKNVNKDQAIVVGNLNINMERQHNLREMDIYEGLKSNGLINLDEQFKTRKCSRYKWMWRTFREGKLMQSICDYILSGKRKN